MAFSFVRSITIDHTKVSGGADLTDYPLCYAGTYSYLKTTGNGGDVTNSSGFDIIFAADSGGVTVLDFTDPKPKSSDGGIALQLHSGGEGNMRFKDIYVRDLSRR